MVWATERITKQKCPAVKQRWGRCQEDHRTKLPLLWEGQKDKLMDFHLQDIHFQRASGASLENKVPYDCGYLQDTHLLRQMIL